MNKKIVIYDPPMCCSSGVCGPNPDQTLIEFQEMFKSLKQSGYDIERYIITQSPEKFKENPQIIKLIQDEQLKVLPVTTIDGVVIKKGSYPTLAELGIKDIPVKITEGCCSGNDCCNVGCNPDDKDCCSGDKRGCC